MRIHPKANPVEIAPKRRSQSEPPAGDGPHLALVLDTHLRRAENVSRGVETDAHALQIDRLTIVREADRRASAESGAHNALALARAEVAVAAPTGMIAVRVRDDGAR